MATTPIPAPESQASLSPFARIIGVFFSPKNTFEDIVRKPGWITPVLVSTVLSIIAVIALNQRVNWREYIAQQIEKNPRAAQLSADQKQQQIEVSAKFTVAIVYVAGIFVPACFALVVGLVMMGAYNLLAGAGARFSAALSIVAHAALVGIVSTPLFLVVLFLKPPGSIDPENPLATNLGVLLPEESAKWLVALCKSFDIFTIWTLILIAIGFAAVNPRKLKGSKSFVIAFSVWATYVVLRVGWAFIFS
ncbi:MAG TPA: YIP1 family protein [Candidatus Udaeobacter sp.]|jgi:Yip1 domain|nr:YIP1 family protein [Candidatus Udaeobacter sp.]